MIEVILVFEVKIWIKDIEGVCGGECFVLGVEYFLKELVFRETYFFFF